jgi:hypothetical protein
VAFFFPFHALEPAQATPDGGELVLPLSLQHPAPIARARGEARRPLARRSLCGESDGLTPVVAAGHLEETGGTFASARPLFAEAATALLPGAERKALHAAITKRTSDPEQRARNLAHAAAGPDERVAASPAESAQEAHRGAFATAAELWELAPRLLPCASTGARKVRVETCLYRPPLAAVRRNLDPGDLQRFSARRIRLQLVRLDS